MIYTAIRYTLPALAAVALAFALTSSATAGGAQPPEKVIKQMVKDPATGTKPSGAPSSGPKVGAKPGPCQPGQPMMDDPLSVRVTGATTC